ncbi:MAG: hypothetical protein ACP5VP_10500 [Candidatus Limnocylindrales bacterium]
MSGATVTVVVPAAVAWKASAAWMGPGIRSVRPASRQVKGSAAGEQLASGSAAAGQVAS